ncbi:filamentous hemagglutinin family domain-containing protein, partial [Candidatus Magnetomorum sp. HK-1]
SGQGNFLNNSNIKITDGNLFIASVGEVGQISINDSVMNASSFDQMNDIELNDTSSINITRNNGTGYIGIVGKDFLLDNSKIIIQSQAIDSGIMDIDIDGSFTLKNTSSIESTNSIFGQGVDISIKSQNLYLDEGGQIYCLTKGVGQSSNINIIVENEINISSYKNENDGYRFSGIYQKVEDGGYMGNTTISSDLIKIIDFGKIDIYSNNSSQPGMFEINVNELEFEKGLINSISRGLDQGINIHVNAFKSILVEGIEHNGKYAGGIDYRSFGNSVGGKIILNAPSLILSNDGIIFNYAGGDAHSAEIAINVDILELRAGGIIKSRLQQNGTNGKITINANKSITIDSLNSINKSQIHLYSDGNSIGGSLFIESPLLLINQGSITAESLNNSKQADIRINSHKTDCYNGGNINLIQKDESIMGKLEINASENIVFDGDNNSQNNLILSGIYILNYGSGNLYEDINITTSTIELVNGGTITVLNITEANNPGRNLTINATDKILINGNNSSSDIFFSNPGKGKMQNLTLITSEIKISNGSIFASNFGDKENGKIDIKADKIDLSNNGQIYIDNRGEGDGMDLQIVASESIVLSGDIDIENPLEQTGISGLSYGKGDSGDISIETNLLKIINNALIATPAYGAGNSGDVTIKATLIEIDNSNLDADTWNDGKAGNILIDTEKLIFTNRGYISADVNGNMDLWKNMSEQLEQIDIYVNSGHPGEGRGIGGNITINANESIILSGSIKSETSGRSISEGGYGGKITINTPNFIIKEFGELSTSTFFNDGNAGNIELNIDSLSLINGGRIYAFSYGKGDAGKIEINAYERISIFGEDSEGINSGIFCTANENGNAGRLYINSPEIDIFNNGKINLSTEKDGTGGLIDIQASKMNIYNEGKIYSEASGKGDAGYISVKT